MSEKSTFSQQAAAITEAISHCQDVMQEPELTWLKDAGRSLNAMKDKQNLYRRVYALAVEHPEIVKFFDEFPEASFWTGYAKARAKAEMETSDD